MQKLDLSNRDKCVVKLDSMNFNDFAPAAVSSTRQCTVLTFYLVGETSVADNWLSSLLSANCFSKLNEFQRRDLILYLYERESARTEQKLQPLYRFPLETFRGYFGKDPGNIRNAVLHSDEYKAYAFSLLDEFQKRDLILYFYERESARTEQNPQPPYTFSLVKFRGFFGLKPADISNTVLHSDEYKAYAEERRRHEGLEGLESVSPTQSNK